MDDPIKYLKSRLKVMCLAELKEYQKILDEKIKHKIDMTAPNDQIAPLILYRGVVEHEMKTRMNTMKSQ
ncbi:MAG: hypothetical protein NUK63_11265 [Candidatus Bathyarchaeum tardum]|nr:MAG: hypothetical protein NUK63_11265 [Candidatus Bathyarchaeum tardum]